MGSKLLPSFFSINPHQYDPVTVAKPAFLTDVRYWIIFALLAWIVIDTLTDKPKPHTAVQVIRDTIEVKAREDVRLGEIVKELKAENEQIKAQALAEKKVFQKKVSGLTQNLSEARDKISAMIDTIPALAEYVATSDSLHAVKDERIVNLENEVILRESMSDKLTVAHEAQLRIRQQIIDHKDEIIVEHEKTIKKQSRLIKWLKVGLPVLGVGGFILGSL